MNSPFNLPEMFLVGTSHITLRRTKLREAAALSAGTLAEKFTALADIQTAAVFLFGSAFFLRQSGDKLPYGGVYPLLVYILEKTSAAKGSAHESITEATEQGGSTAEKLFPQTAAVKGFGTTLSGLSKSLRA